MIVPNNFEDTILGNLHECIMVTGYKLLDLFFNLTKEDITNKHTTTTTTTTTTIK